MIADSLSEQIEDNHTAIARHGWLAGSGYSYMIVKSEGTQAMMLLCDDFGRYPLMVLPPLEYGQHFDSGAGRSIKF
tara:strand:+ start:309 stop:536 length:228 start_codon:yes stop_codon:yes gene_type:complete